ncbi:MAG TPA: alpha/beta fold hydrolase [Myxococcaceae bacterium]|nr:alpha/beta fold hydrolase [Myxococcaceae bacterium]
MALWANTLARWRRRMRYLGGYLDFDRSGNRIRRRTDFSHCPRPVLLLYGLLSTRRSCRLLERRLRHDGYGVFSIDLGGLAGAFNTRGIDQSAEHVRDKVERLYARYPGMGPLSIIGHSKGGLIGRYYIARLGGDARVRTLITLGTPHQGTPRAYLGCATVGWLAPSVWQMTPRSSFLRRLNLGPWPPGVRLVSLYSRRDACTPYPSGMVDLRRAGDFVNVELDDLRHRDFLVARSAYQVVRSELAGAALPWRAPLEACSARPRP